jgi:AhpC/TSA family protein
MMQPMSRTLALAALVVTLGTVAAFVVLLQVLLMPLPPASYLGSLAAAVVLAAVAVARSRRWLPVTALVVSVVLLALAGVFHFVLMRVPAMPATFAIGAAVPDFTLPDATGVTVHLADFRGKKPVVLVFYRGYW